MNKRLTVGLFLVALGLAVAGRAAGLDAQPRDDAGSAPGPMGPGMMGPGRGGQGMMGPGRMGPGMMQTPPPPATGASGEVIFESQCAQCHVLGAAASGLVGPSLHGLFGRRAGTASGYAYSAAMRDSGVVWDERTLDRFIAAPQSYIPGDNMPYAGIADASARRRLLAYLKAATR